MSSFAAAPRTTAAESRLNTESCFWETMLDSEYQAGPVKVEVLLPEPMDHTKTYPVLYILPVEGAGKAYGHGLTEAKKADIASKYGVVCVYPSFRGIPWYGNHATDPRNRQNDYVVKALVPFIEGKYPVRKDKEGRLLLGFSKAGWGAFTLLLRHPDVFGYAAAWDVPFMIDGENSGKDWGPMGLSANMGTKETMLQFLPTRLAADNAVWLKKRCRLVVGNGIFWKKQNEQMHAFLEVRGIPHVYRGDLQLEHRWDTGWLAPMAEELVKLATALQN